MKPSETAEILTRIAAVHRSTVGKVDVMSWHDLIGDLDYDDALEAVRRHYTRSREWIMPADVITGVRAIREERLARADKSHPPAADPDRAADYRRALNAQITSLANRRDLNHAIDGPTLPARRRPQPPQDPDAAQRAAALTQPCPHCRAVPGRHCVIAGTRQALHRDGRPTVHHSRIDAANAASEQANPDDHHAEAS